MDNQTEGQGQGTCRAVWESLPGPRLMELREQVMEVSGREMLGRSNSKYSDLEVTMLVISEEQKEASVTKGHCTRRRMAGKEARQVTARRPAGHFKDFDFCSV